MYELRLCGLGRKRRPSPGEKTKRRTFLDVSETFVKSGESSAPKARDAPSLTYMAGLFTNSDIFKCRRIKTVTDGAPSEENNSKSAAKSAKAPAESSKAPASLFAGPDFDFRDSILRKLHIIPQFLTAECFAARSLGCNALECGVPWR